MRKQRLQRKRRKLGRVKEKTVNQRKKIHQRAINTRKILKESSRNILKKAQLKKKTKKKDTIKMGRFRN